MLLSNREMKWTLMDRMILRTTGFPFQMVEKLNSKTTAVSLEHWEHIQQRKEELAKTYLLTIYDRMMSWEWSQVGEEQQYNKVKKARRHFLKRTPIPEEVVRWWLSRDYPKEWQEIPLMWNAFFHKESEVLLEAKGKFENEFGKIRAGIMEVAADPHFQEAVYFSSPSAFQALERHMKLWQQSGEEGPALNKEVRKNESLIFGYLQRFCTKNDTTSFFGPINYGRFDRNNAHSLEIKHTEGRKLQRKAASFSQWCIRAMTSRISSDPAVRRHIAPRKNPLVTIEDNRLKYHFTDRTRTLPDVYLSLLQHIDGQTKPDELSRLTEVPTENIEYMLGQLKKIEVIRHEIELCATRVPLLEDLQGIVEQLPPAARDRWDSFVKEAVTLRDQFEASDWPEKARVFEAAEQWFESWHPDEVRRKGGTLYGDRLILTEDCVGSVNHLQIGGKLYERLSKQSVLVLEFLKIPAALRWLDYQEAALGIFDELKEERSSIAYTEIIHRLDDPGVPFVSSRVKEFEEKASSLLTETSEGYVLDEQQVTQLIREYEDTIDQVYSHAPFSFPSPDLMIAAHSMKDLEEDTYQIVLGEIHDDWSTIYDGVFGFYHPENEALKKEMQDFISAFPMSHQMSSVVSNRRHKHITPELPGWTIELASKSTKSSRQVIPIGEVNVVKQGERLTLDYRGKEIILYPGDVRTIAHGAFSLPRIISIDLLDTLEHTPLPRIYIGEMVYQRKKWRINTQDYKSTSIPSGYELLKEGYKFKAAYHLPTQFFVKWSNTEKPVFVDIRNYWALDWLFRMMKNSSSIEITEFLPGAEQLFWEGEHGKQTCEFRMGFTYSHQPFPTKLEGVLANESVNR
ncbi:lantibiotic dehydratase [Paenibacillus amylolyticus]|uniref:lantibiotic dehydratase n=1 Tax=Paenibacillus amylolyticus TaxID=1451 RepID=UPI0032421EA2